MCIENRFAGWCLCVCSQVNSEACLGVTVRYVHVPRVKTGLFDKWESGKKNSSANSLELPDQWGFKLPVTTAELMPRDPLPQVAMLAMPSISGSVTCLFSPS